jgi:heme-degrading monooxygenase HmoA
MRGALRCPCDLKLARRALEGKMVKVVLEHRTKSRENTKNLVKLIKKIRLQAKLQPGFITGETLVDTEDPCHVIVISTWKTQEDWKAWDNSPIRGESRPAIEDLLVEPFNAVVLPLPVVWREDLVNVF